jgi:acyl-CoA synthetase (AMP-forming)/AMP-acid ligase II
LKALIHQQEFESRLALLAGSLPSLRIFLPVAESGDSEYESALRDASPGRNFEPRSADDLYIIYTGGTTGMPRGVMWRQEDVFFTGLRGGRPAGEPIARPEELADIARSGEQAMTILPAAPLIHGAAQWASLIGFFSGGKVVLCPGRNFNPQRIAALIGEEQVSTINLVGDAMAAPLSEALLAGPGDTPGQAGYDTSSLMVISSAGAILSEAIRKRLQELLPSTLILNNFGATEAGYTGTQLVDGEAGGARRSFFMDDTCAVLDEDGSPVEPGSGRIGRLSRRGRIPLGYYRDPEKTRATFFEIDGVRWVIPGDMAMVEADGTITVLGRGAVCINSGGEKIFPEEVEEALKSLPQVADAVVVGVPDERWGERVAAIIKERPGSDLTLDLIAAHCRLHVAGYKVPRELHLVPEVVRHPSGKPDYQWARRTALGQMA